MGAWTEPVWRRWLFRQKEATQDLNAIVHGAIKEERDAFLRLHKDDSLVVIDAPSFLKDTGKAYVMKFGLFLFLKKNRSAAP